MCRLFSQIWQEMVKNPQIGVGKKNYQYYIDYEEMKSFTFDYSDKIMTRICCVDAKKKNQILSSQFTCCCLKYIRQIDIFKRKGCKKVN